MIYDPESNILSIEIAKGQIDHAREFSNFIVHLSLAGKPILVEVLNASKLVGQVARFKKTEEVEEMVATN